MKRVIILFSLALLLILGIAEQVSACSCVRTTPCRSFNYASAVFVGKAVGAKEQRTIEDYSEVYQNSNTNAASSEPKKITYDVGEIYFEVEEAFYGVKKGERITIHSGTGGGDCGYWFKRGETYLIYASSFADEETRATGFATSICSGTKPLDSAGQDLEYLRDLSAESKGKFFGRVRQEFNFDGDNKQIGYAGLTLNFQKLETGEIFSTTTDSEGNFDIDVPAGKYKIVPLLPEYASVEKFGDEYDPTAVEVKADACLDVYLSVKSKSEISGKLISFDGKPLKGIDVELIDSETNEWVTGGETEADGSFSITAVPAGKYLLAVNKNISPNAESPFPTFFYPNSPGEQTAKNLTVRLGETIKNLIFQLPPPLKQQLITGTVVWANGKPAADTKIELKDIAEDTFFRAERVTKTDAAGKFALKGFVGRSYRLEAKFEKYEPLTEEEALKEMEQTGKISKIVSADGEPQYVRVTRDVAKIKPFKVANKPLIFKIILKQE